MRLVLKALDSVANSDHHALVIQEAHAASVQAERTGVPQLVLPCLFEERVLKALQWAEESERRYWRRIMPELAPLLGSKETWPPGQQNNSYAALTPKARSSLTKK